MSKGTLKLKNVLTAFANYERQVDYVQGMNFIVGQLLLHCSETVAFWLFVSLIEDCDMRDIYLPQLPGLGKHSRIIELLLEKHLPALHGHLQKHQMRADLFLSEWVFGLFSSIIPLDLNHDFFTQFFEHKWIFFYQLVLVILSEQQDLLLGEEDLYAILHRIKSQLSDPRDGRKEAHNDGYAASETPSVFGFIK